MTFPKAFINATKPNDESTPGEVLWDVYIGTMDGMDEPIEILVRGVESTTAKAWQKKSEAGTLELKLG